LAPSRSRFTDAARAFALYACSMQGKIRASRALVLLAAVTATSALLPACAGQTPFAAPAPANVMSPQVRSVSPQLRYSMGTSWMDPIAKSSALLYVSSLDIPSVLVYNYTTGKLAGEIFGRSQVEGLCVDKAGNIWIASVGLGKIFKYAHGGAHPIATLRDPNEAPWGCAVDPTTGDLAVANFESDTGGAGSISIYKNAAGTPKIYPAPSELLYLAFVAYGPDGTLYLDGTTQSGSGRTFGLASFKNGTFTALSLNPAIPDARALAVVGSKLNIANDDNPGAPSIDRYTVKGSNATKAGSTPLSDAYVVSGFDIVGKTIAIGDSNGYEQNGSVEYFAYPAGGSPTKSFTYLPYFIPQAIVVSEVTK
jgi:DNA-binding beta-propeller fold protein YncE